MSSSDRSSFGKLQNCLQVMPVWQALHLMHMLVLHSGHWVMRVERSALSRFMKAEQFFWGLFMNKYKFFITYSRTGIYIQQKMNLPTYQYILRRASFSSKDFSNLTLADFDRTMRHQFWFRLISQHFTGSKLRSDIAVSKSFFMQRRQYLCRHRHRKVFCGAEKQPTQVYLLFFLLGVGSLGTVNLALVLLLVTIDGRTSELTLFLRTTLFCFIKLKVLCKCKQI